MKTEYTKGEWFGFCLFPAITLAMFLGVIWLDVHVIVKVVVSVFALIVSALLVLFEIILKETKELVNEVKELAKAQGNE